LGNVFSVGGAQDVELIAVTDDLQDLAVQVSYVNAPPAVPGDYNHNGQVDAADYVVWRKMQGQSGLGLAADGDNNMVVNQLDYDYWRARYGRTSGSGAATSAAVPEPSVIAILIAACTVGLFQRAHR
jgi:hypothetical protein